MYEYRFKDREDIEECRQYLSTECRIPTTSILLMGNRYFEFNIDKGWAHSVLQKLMNNPRVESPELHTKVDYTSCFMNPNGNLKYKLSGFVHRSENEEG